MPIFAWNTPLLSLVFLKRSLVFPILLFSSISLHWLLRKAFLSLPVILWNSEFKWEYLSFSPSLFASLLFTAICKASLDSHFAFLYFFPMGMVLTPVFCTMSQRVKVKVTFDGESAVLRFEVYNDVHTPFHSIFSSLVHDISLFVLFHFLFLFTKPHESVSGSIMSDSLQPCRAPGSLSMGFSRQECWILKARMLESATEPSSRGILLTQRLNPNLLCLLHWQEGSLLLGSP